MSYEENSNYKSWYEVHKRMFGKIFTDAFCELNEGRMMLTAALNKLSQRDCNGAAVILADLERLALSDDDVRAVEYFTGLCCEMGGDIGSADEHYTKMAECGGRPIFALAFHPYYRTAKFRQRDSEPKSAEYYFKKALSIYEGYALTGEVAGTVGMILYDIATLRVFMHDYGECARFIALSEKTLPEENPQREFIKTTLAAVNGDTEGARKSLQRFKAPFKEAITDLVEEVAEGRHIHYSESERDRSGFDKFKRTLAHKRDKIKDMISRSDVAGLEKMIDGMLAECFSYATVSFKRCRAEIENGVATLYCKTGYSRTLRREYDALLKDNAHGVDLINFHIVDCFNE